MPKVHIVYGRYAIVIRWQNNIIFIFVFLLVVICATTQTATEAGYTL